MKIVICVTLRYLMVTITNFELSNKFKNVPRYGQNIPKYQIWIKDFRWRAQAELNVALFRTIKT